MSAEAIAEVIADIRKGRVQHPAAFDEAGMLHSLALLDRAQLPQPVVDCTAIYNSQREHEEIKLYDDFPSIVPPWENALLCFVNVHGNVICMQVHRRDWDGAALTSEEWFSGGEHIEWERVRWLTETAIWVGGKGAGEWGPTAGPVHMFRHAIHEDGSPANINWLALTARRGQFGKHDEVHDGNLGVWEMSAVVLGASLNFLSATNVEIAEPQRKREVRKRIARTGVTVQTIVVRPPGKHRVKNWTGAVRQIGEGDTVLSSVRGHWSHYGPKYNRGLLFGKIAGKFWIPSHIRGAGEEVPKDYVLKPALIKDDGTIGEVQDDGEDRDS